MAPENQCQMLELFRPVLGVHADVAEVMHAALPDQTGQNLLANELRARPSRPLYLEGGYLEGVLSTVRCDKVCIFVCSVRQGYLAIPALRRSSIEKIVASLRSFSTSWITGKGCAKSSVIPFKRRKSTQKRNFPSFFLDGLFLRCRVSIWW
jgi:hypothetical protein